MTAAVNYWVRSDVVRSALEEVIEKDGTLTSEAVLKAATPVSSPLHGYFEWDDSIAGHRWRIHQASSLIRIYVDSDETRMLLAVPAHAGQQPGTFYRRERVLTEPDLRARFVEDALGELAAWRRRFADLKELKRFFQVIDPLLPKSQGRRG